MHRKLYFAIPAATNTYARNIKTQDRKLVTYRPTQCKK